jgi:hypothetical protein
MLHRLGPLVNLTTHDSQSGDGSMTMDVKVHLDSAVVNIRYGTTVKAEKSRILRHAIKITIRKAWQRQQDLLASGRHREAHPWTPLEKEQLLTRGLVDNYDTKFDKNLNEFPELSGDLMNVKFVKIL